MRKKEKDILDSKEEIDASIRDFGRRLYEAENPTDILEEALRPVRSEAFREGFLFGKEYAFSAEHKERSKKVFH